MGTNDTRADPATTPWTVDEFDHLVNVAARAICAADEAHDSRVESTDGLASIVAEAIRDAGFRPPQNGSPSTEGGA